MRSSLSVRRFLSSNLAIIALLFLATSPQVLMAGGAIPSPLDVTDNETVVGLYDASGTGSYDHGYYWQGGNGMGFYHITTGAVLDMGLMSGVGSTNESSSNGLSSDGSIVGGFSTNTSGNYEAARWTTSTGWVGLGDFAGGSTASFVNGGVSGDGLTFAGTGNTAAGSEAFIWTSGGGMVGLGTLPTGIVSYGSAISLDGTTIVGMADTSGGWRAYVWTSGGGMVDLGAIGGGFMGSRSNGVSDNGSVVVGSTTTASGWEAFMWTSGGGMISLGDLAGGGVNASASAVSGDGTLIGGRADDGLGGFNGTAFIWDSINGMQNLQDVLTNTYGYNLTGWHLSNVTTISPDGHTLAGYGDFGGNIEMWMAVIPEPSTYAMILMGIACVFFGDYRKQRWI